MRLGPASTFAEHASKQPTPTSLYADGREPGRFATAHAGYGPKDTASDRRSLRAQPPVVERRVFFESREGNVDRVDVSAARQPRRVDEAVERMRGGVLLIDNTPVISASNGRRVHTHERSRPRGSRAAPVGAGDEIPILGHDAPPSCVAAAFDLAEAGLPPAPPVGP